MPRSIAKSASKRSAGILLYRGQGDGTEVSLGHPGGPFWRKKDLGAWSIPKGLVAEAEDPLAAAKREFAEETRFVPAGEAIALGEAMQPGGKLVAVWAIEGTWDPAELKSNLFGIEWPPRSGKRLEFPELDRAAWFGIAEARRRIVKGQVVLLDRLLAQSI